MRTLACHNSLVSALGRKAVILGLSAALIPPARGLAQTIKVIGEPGQLLSGCPVEMVARQQAASTLREVPGSLSGSWQGLRQGVTLTLKGRSALVVTDAEIVVHGLSPTPHAVSVSGKIDADVTKAFHLKNITASEFRSDVWMARVSALRWIEVKSMTYSDGSEWHESSAAKCGIRPDPFMLVSAR